jgi:thiol:disulfide interchange protein DsbA
MPTPLRVLQRTLAALMALLLLGPALAQTPQEGATFRTISPPQPSGSPGKIEVIEFFSYACPHCAHFYPLLESWAAKQPKDVVVRKVPVGFNRDAWINLQRAYYALQASGDLDKLDGALFHAIHEEHLQLFDEQSLADWVGKNGGHADKFAAAYVSFGVNNQTVQADTMMEKYGVEAVPSLAVNGRYVVVTTVQEEHQALIDMLTNTDQLIARVRAEQAAKPAAAKSAAGKTGAVNAPAGKTGAAAN